MAQLPPKVSNMSLNWSSFGGQKSPSMGANVTSLNLSNQPSWVDEFLNFSTSKRGAHRRSVSDSIAFLEAPICGVNGDSEFDTLDDEQLTSLFSDDIPPPPHAERAIMGTSSSISTPSDNNSFNEEKTEEKKLKNEWEEAQSGCKVEAMAPFAEPAATSETIADPKRVKRILANRQSAQRSRVRKLQYISELEQSVSTLQNDVSSLSPQVAYLDHHRSLLTLGNSHLKQRIAALAKDKIFKDAHQEALKKEIERLRQVYHQQTMNKMASSTSNSNGLLEKELLRCKEGQ